MNLLHRRNFVAGISGLLAALPAVTKAQFTEQEVRNNADIVATGDVNVSQSASGSQDATFGVYVDGELVTQDGVYQTSTGQVVVNDGRIVATGDVNLSQSASGTQSSTAVVTYPSSDGDRASSCQPGAVIANPTTGQIFYQRDDCCWYAACANRCQGGCEGDYCG